MENLFGTIGTYEPSYLLASNALTDCIGISVEPGHGTVPAGCVMYRKSGDLYAPAAAANIALTSNLVVLRDAVDTTASAGVAAAAAAYRRAKFIAGKVIKDDGNSGYEAISAAEAIVLRAFGLELSPMDNWAGDADISDNRVAQAITVTAGTGGSASASKQTAKMGETVTLTITPSSGKVLDEIKVTAGDVTLELNDGVYSFVMGDKAVTVTVSFKSAS